MASQLLSDRENIINVSGDKKIFPLQSYNDLNQGYGLQHVSQD
jgi:hypothetical protein